VLLVLLKKTLVAPTLTEIPKPPPQLPPDIRALPAYQMFWFCLYNLLAFAWAVPVPAPEQDKSLSWASTPPLRGTLSILFSCTAALGLCVWTGVHLNLHPIQNEGKKLERISRFLGRFMWALIALLAPDIVLAIALHQFLVARRYRHEVNKLSTKTRGLVGKKIDKEQRQDMTLKTAFFAIMGGFAVEFNTVNGPQSLTLRVKDIVNVGMMDRIHDYPLSDIDDKSKASGIAKSIACFQAGWTLLQCLGRLEQRLYITFLELNTAVHVIIAIVMYGIWWSKPVDVGRPIIIDRRGTDNSASTVYRTCVQQVLENAKKQLEDGLNQGGGTLDKQKEARVAAVLCRSIKVAPEEIASMVKSIPDQIGRYFTRSLRRDIYDGVKEHHFDGLSGPIPLPVVESAYHAAFSVAHKTAFKVAHEMIYHTVNRLSSGVVTNDGEMGPEMKLANALDKAEPVLRKEIIGVLREVKSVLQQELGSARESALTVLRMETSSAHDVAETDPAEAIKKFLEEAKEALRSEMTSALDKVREEIQKKLTTSLENSLGKARRDSENEIRKSVDQQMGPQTEIQSAWNNVLEVVQGELTRAFGDDGTGVRQKLTVALNKALDSVLGTAETDPRPEFTSTLLDFEKKFVDSAEWIIGREIRGRLDKVVADHPTELTKALNVACRDTRTATFKAALKAAFHAAIRKSSQPAVGKPPTDSGWNVRAALRAAHSATRGAARQAVRLAALDAALGKAAAADVARSAFRSVLMRLCAEAGIETDYEKDLQPCEEALYNAVHEAFREQYRIGTTRANIGSDIMSTMTLVRDATLTGIYKAVEAEINKTVDTETEKAEKTEGSGSNLTAAFMKAKEELRALEKHEGDSQSSDTFWKRFQTTFQTAGGVILGQLIHVPELFWHSSNAGKAATGAVGPAMVAVGGGAGGGVASPGAASAADRAAKDTTKHTETADTSPATGHRSTDEHQGELFDSAWRKCHRTRLLLCTAITGAFYGGLLLTKWNDGRFTTTIEQWFWRMACCIGTATIIPVVILASIPFLRPNSIQRIICIALCSLCWAAFLAARMYIIVESFISLRALPPDAFQTVQWSASIPHI
jgi:hypothetical protein